MAVRSHADQHAHAARRLLDRILPAERSFAVRLWNGDTLPAQRQGEETSPAATIVVMSAEALGGMLQLPVDLHMGEAFVRGQVDVEGDLEATIELLDHAELDLSLADWLAVARDAAALRGGASGALGALAAVLRGRVHSAERDRQAISHHYDVSNKFYRLWLDRRMVYSCAYFEREDTTLEDAQLAKLDHICRKLRLEPGDTLLDVGCGWGALVQRAAERYGVRAVGITVSERQAELGNASLREAGLHDRARIELRDYRDVDDTYDKIASVGMAEHVGDDAIDTYFAAAIEHLKPGGLMLNHAIHRGPVDVGVDGRIISGEFIRRYVFPDGEILPAWRSLQAAERAGFEVRDVEDLREHYASTLRHWVRNLEANWDAAVAEVGTERARVWRIYMAGSAHRFASGRLAIHQELLAKADGSGRAHVPMTRRDLYL